MSEKLLLYKRYSQHYCTSIRTLQHINITGLQLAMAPSHYEDAALGRGGAARNHNYPVLADMYSKMA